METTPNLCKNGHDKNLVGTLKNGYCRECGRESRRKQWADATPEQRLANRKYQRERYAAGLTQKNVTQFICKKGHDKRVTGVAKNGACRQCSIEQDREARKHLTEEDIHHKNALARNRNATDQGRANLRKYHLKQTYNLTREQYDEMVKAQENKCAICKQPETRVRNGRVLELNVDHDHETEAIRLLLCNSCNTGIGKFRDDPQLLIAAAEYLFSFQHDSAQPASSADKSASP